MESWCVPPPSPRVFPRYKKYHLIHIRGELPAFQTLLRGGGPHCFHRQLLPGRLTVWYQATGEVDVGEGGRLVKRDTHHGSGGAQAPAGRLCWPEEVPPTGVGLCAARHPGSVRQLPSS